MTTVSLMGFNIIKNDLLSIPFDQKVLINTISPNSYGLNVKDGEMRDALVNSDFLVLDGVYFGLAPLLLKGQVVKRITGWDCFMFFSKKLNETGGKVFFLGSTDETLERIVCRYRHDFPNIETGSYSPPYKAKFSEEDNIKMREAINNFNPDILFVGLTAPKQEKWSHQNIKHLNVHIVCTIGNVFDWYAGNTKRPGKFWQKMGLEWLGRIFYRPEIFFRNTANQLLFLWHLILLVLKIKKHG